MKLKESNKLANKKLSYSRKEAIGKNLFGVIRNI